MAGFSFAEAYGQDLFKEWARLGKIRKPVRYSTDVIPTIILSTLRGFVPGQSSDKPRR